MVDVWELLKIVVLGVVQGITEWLPVSSTGHMILVNELMPLRLSEEFVDMFLVVVQLGSILAVAVLYFHRLNPFSLKKTPPQRWATVQLWLRVVLAAVPGGIIGVLFDDLITKTFYNYFTVAIALIVYGICFIVLERRNRSRTPAIRSTSQLSYRTAFLIGVFQVLALIPGTSRSGSTILGAMLLGTSRQVAAEFSFFLAVPMMFGASAVKLLRVEGSYTGAEWGALGLGMAVAFLVSVFAIKFLMGYIKKHDFTAFGWYRIVLGVVVLLYFTLLAPAA